MIVNSSMTTLLMNEKPLNIYIPYTFQGGNWDLFHPNAIYLIILRDGKNILIEQ